MKNDEGSDDARRGRLGRLFVRLAASPRSPWIVAALAFLITVPLLGSGRFLDDWMHVYVLRGNDLPGGPRGIWDMYRFADGGEGTRASYAMGVFPWWTAPDLKLAFFRPLGSLWVAADYALWGESSFMPHLEMSLVYAALAYVAVRAYREILGKAAAAAIFAGVLFAVDDAHSMAVVWIANRYALLAGVFGLLSLFFFAKPTGGARRASILSAVCFALGLASGETGLGVAGYLVAFAWFAHPAGKRAALLALSPHAAVLAVWAVIYKLLGYGAAGSSLYIDPTKKPVEFCAAVAERLPRLIAGQFFLPPAEMWSMLPASGRLTYMALATALAGVIVYGLYRATRGDVRAAALGVGALLAAIPPCAMVADDRNLLIPGFGAFGVLALAMERVWSGQARGLLARGVASVMIGLHLFLAPLLMPVRALNASKSMSALIARGAASIPSPPDITGKRLVVLSAPDVLVTNFMIIDRYLDDKPKPKQALIVTSQSRGTGKLERVSEQVFIVRNDLGQNVGPFDPVYRDVPLAVGQKFEQSGMIVQVLELTDDGALRALRVEFTDPLSDYVFLAWEGRAFVEAPPVAVGETRDLPSTDLFRQLQ